MKRWLVLCFILLALMLSACDMAESRAFKYTTNEDQYSNARVTWFSQGDWGGSLDASFVKVGEYDFTTTSITLTEKKAAPASFDQAFYNAEGMKENYTLEGVFTINSMTLREGVFNKFGFFAAFKDPANYVHVLLHPLASENFVTVSSIVDGSWDLIWRVYEIPEDVDFNDEVHFAILKMGAEFRMYVNGVFIGSFIADIDEAQVGVLSEEMTYTVSEFVFEDITAFPRITLGYGEAQDEGLSVEGDYDITQTSAFIYGDNDIARIFSEAIYNDFAIKTLLNFTKVDPLTDHEFGFYLLYEDVLNHARLYFVNNLQHLVFEQVVDGVLEQHTYDLSDEMGLPLIEIYKIGDAFKIYFNDILMVEGDIAIASGQIGFYSKNANGSYQQFSILAAADFPVTTWGGSYDGVIARKGTYTVVGQNITITSTEMGGYGAMEQVFFNGTDPLVDFEAEATMYHGAPTIDVNNKYGFMFYHSPNNYIELFIIPHLNALYAVSKVNGDFSYLWTVLTTFEEGYDHTSPDIAFKVIKEAGTFKIYFDDDLVYEFTQAAYAELAMQVALVAEKTAPVTYAQFYYGENRTETETWGGSYDGLIASLGEYDVDGATIVLETTEMGGYGAMERLYYNGTDPLVDFEAEADMYHGMLTIDANNKYGFMFYHNLTNYLEIFIIPGLNAAYAVSKVDGAWVYLWTKLFDFDPDHDHTVAGTVLRVVKTGANFEIYLNDTLVYEFTEAAYAELAMQVALVAEKTAPVYFSHFTFQQAVSE